MWSEHSGVTRNADCGFYLDLITFHLFTERDLGHTLATVYIWRSEDDLWEGVSSFPSHEPEGLKLRLTVLVGSPLPDELGLRTTILHLFMTGPFKSQPLYL